MKAIVQDRYGPPDVLEVREVDRPEVEEGRILVRMQAASANPFDWHMMTGKPFLVRPQRGWLRPKRLVQGGDGSGVVEAVGDGVTGFEVGDAVWGGFRGSFAEYSTTAGQWIAAKPASVSFEEAAASPTAALTALQGLRDLGRLEAGQKVLINGASGGVGTFAVQIAKAMGAHVTAVCSTGNLELVKGLGADVVIDYTTTDYTKSHERFDLIFDTVTTKGIRANRRVMKPGARWVQAGMTKKRSVTMLLLRMLKMKVASMTSNKKMVGFLAKITSDDLVVMNDYLASGKVKPAIGRRFTLEDTPEAIRMIGGGHTRGKSVIVIGA